MKACSILFGRPSMPLRSSPNAVPMDSIAASNDPVVLPPLDTVDAEFARLLSRAVVWLNRGIWLLRFEIPFTVYNRNYMAPSGTMSLFRE